MHVEKLWLEDMYLATKKLSSDMLWESCRCVKWMNERGTSASYIQR